MPDEDSAWIDYREQFAKVYDAADYASPLQARVMHASHRLVEKPYGESTHFGRVVEIGAGTGAHVPFVRHRYGEYVLTDLDPQTLEVAKGKNSHAAGRNLKFEPQSGGALSYADASFDRVIATHVLEHIYPPHLVLKEWMQVLRPGGVLSVLIPTDPGLAWRLGWRLGPRKNALAQGISYDYVMAREHVNSCNNLIAILRHYFPGSKEAWWPLPVSSIDLNLFFAFHAVK